MKNESAVPYILGLDLGSASLGWAMISLPDGNPGGILAAGVRVFDPGVDGDINSGKDESRNRSRREARLHRRLLRRRAWRSEQLFLALQSAALLPSAPPDTPLFTKRDRSLARDRVLAALDSDLRSAWGIKKPPLHVQPVALQAAVGAAGSATAAAAPAPAVPPALPHVLPYFLRARALHHRLEPCELGRALYHLGQRRGFQSNRKSSPKPEEKPGEVKQAITDLEQAMRAANARTLGEFFSRSNPEDSAQLIRRRWTARAMFKNEFELIWARQAQFHSQLTPELKKQISHLLFDQRPVTWKRSTIGRCSLEPKRRRAPIAALAAQRFRLLQKLNDLEIISPGSSSRPLNDYERATVLALLEAGDQTFADLRKALKLRRGEKFNLEEGGEKNIPGDRTGSLMRSSFGDRWNAFSPEAQEQIVNEWRSIENQAALARRLAQHWGLDEPSAQKLATHPAEEGHCGYSRLALSKLLPPMENGVAFKTAEKDLYGARIHGCEVHALLPPARASLPELRNPAVERALTELRKVVNALIRKHGKPREIRIELARELRKPRKARIEISEKMRGREKQRSFAREELQKLGIPVPSRADIEKFLLWKECGGECPYTGRRFSPRDLFNQDAQFDVEHILPLSRFPDDSLRNKTLCYNQENRLVKGGKTPWEAYHGSPQYDEILTRVAAWDKSGEKLALFKLDETAASELAQEFSARRLADSSYIAAVAQKYLALLYGGRDVIENSESRRVIRATNGEVTAQLRRSWKLESILGHGEGKGRHDHRHHAVDAVVTALTEDGWIKRLSDRAAHNKIEYGRANFGGLEWPWKDFVSSVRQVIDALRISHRPEHKLSGPLHDETNYSAADKDLQAKGRSVVRIRRQLQSIKAGEIEHIVDKAVRTAVEQRLQELGGDLKQLQLSAALNSAVAPPALIAKDGRRIPIRKVRIRKPEKIVAIGKAANLRHVALGNNHHVEIFALLNQRGDEKAWDAEVVTRLDAVQRNKRGEALVNRNQGPQTRFKFSLMGNDLVELDGRSGREVYVLRTIGESSTGKIQFAMVRERDARKLAEMKAEKKTTQDASIFLQPVPDTLRKMNARKVEIDLLGNLHYLDAHD